MPRTTRRTPKEKKMSNFRLAPLPSNASIADAVTVAVCAWFTLAAGTLLAGGEATPAADLSQRAVLMEEAGAAVPTPIPVAAANPSLTLSEARPAVYEKIVVEASRIHAS
jgi:hypothetical protein